MGAQLLIVLAPSEGETRPTPSSPRSPYSGIAAALECTA
jgi:hypothetical protein